MENLDFREKAKKYGIPFYLIAKELGIGPSALSIWLRTELEGEKRERVFTAIDAIVKRRDAE